VTLHQRLKRGEDLLVSEISGSAEKHEGVGVRSVHVYLSHGCWGEKGDILLCPLPYTSDFAYQVRVDRVVCPHFHNPAPQALLDYLEQILRPGLHVRHLQLRHGTT
jgi:hypothetical protein